MANRVSETFQRDATFSIVPGSRVVKTNETARVGIPTAGGAHHHQATVELIRENGLVKAIDVTCICGEIIRLWCSYEAANSDGSRKDEMQ